MRTGSLYNNLFSNSANANGEVKPEVGMGATYLGWTDRHAYTIIEVSASGKTIKVQRDRAIRTDKLGMSDAQSYLYTPDPNGEVRTIRLSKKGWDKGRFAIGFRKEYYDYTF